MSSSASVVACWLSVECTHLAVEAVPVDLNHTLSRAPIAVERVPIITLLPNRTLCLSVAAYQPQELCHPIKPESLGGIQRDTDKPVLLQRHRRRGSRGCLPPRRLPTRRLALPTLSPLLLLLHLRHSEGPANDWEKPLRVVVEEAGSMVRDERSLRGELGVEHPCEGWQEQCHTYSTDLHTRL